MTSISARFSVIVRGSSLPPGSASPLHVIAGALQKHIERDAVLQVACASLRRAGLTLVVRVDTAPGDGDAVRVVLAAAGAVVRQWSSEDRELLRSLGIASEEDDSSEQRPAKPGWR